MAFGKLPNPGDGDSQEDLAEINIIPLVDVMLVLLIIFMVAAPLSISGIKVNLPVSAVTGGKIDKTRVILSVSEKGEYFLSKTQVPPTELTQRLSAVFEHRASKELYIRADEKVIYARVIDAMTAARLAGVKKMSMLTKPKVSDARGS